MAALRYLAFRDRSESEMRLGLGRRGYAESEIDETVTRLKSEGLLNDPRLAAHVATRRMENGRVGRLKVRHELERRGFARDVREAGLTKALVEVSEASVLDEAARRYWAAHGRVPPEKRLGRLYAFLMRRGFPGSLVGERLRALWPGLEVTEEIPEEAL